MHARSAAGRAAARRGRHPGRAAAAVVAAAAAILAAGCSSVAKTGGKPPASGAVTRCGTTRTAANVPVNVEVEHGQVSCATAMTVERRYARAILSGHAPGNGGGGPISVQGWTCQGFPTPEVLKTGQASKCVSGASEILAILPAPA
jgi:hypothetical protein